MIVETMNYDEYCYIIKIGNNAQENWDLISSATQNDIWFHLGDNRPSPHVILQIPENYKSTKIPKRVINRCCVLCKQHSKYENIKKVTIIYTEIKNVSKGDKIGSVYTKKTHDKVL